MYEDLFRVLDKKIKILNPFYDPDTSFYTDDKFTEQYLPPYVLALRDKNKLSASPEAFPNAQSIKRAVTLARRKPRDYVLYLGKLDVIIS